MKKFNNLSVKVKVSILLGITSFAVFSLICLLLMFPLRAISLEDSTQIAQLHAELAGKQLTVKINGAGDAVRAYSAVIKQIVASEDIAKEAKREILIEQITELLEAEKILYDIWCIFEPDALDGLDALYVNRLGGNSVGAFTPYLSRGSKLTVVPEEIINTGILTRIPKSTGREIITEPYYGVIHGKREKVISISIPVVVNGKYAGAVGTDFQITELNNLLSGVLNSNESGQLVTDRGTIAVHPDMERVGARIENGKHNFLSRMAEGRIFDGFYTDSDGTEIYKVFVPVNLGESGATWFYEVDIPRSYVYANANRTEKYLIIYCLFGIALIAIAGWFLMASMLKGVADVTGLIRQLSLGNINLRIDDNQNQDEIGTMKKELNILISGLKDTSGFARKIGQGNLDAEFQPLSDNDELGSSLLEMRQSLLNAANEQTARAKEEEQRNWGTAGLAKFAEILRRDNNDMEALTHNVISNMVKYLDINQGGVFILNDAENDAEKLLELKACYAFDRKKFNTKKIRIGEGLVGACFLEGNHIYMTDIPHDYIAIKSGLGDANPKSLLICPLKVNDEVFGVIELASFRPFEQFQLDFVLKVSESIAATISSVNVNIRTNRLLVQTKLQAEEMANVEEELRQNMEEMQATQEEMRRREIELQEALKNSKLQI